MIRNGRKRLCIEIPLALYYQVKEVSQKRNITLTRVILRGIIRQLAEENKYTK